MTSQVGSVAAQAAGEVVSQPGKSSRPARKVNPEDSNGKVPVGSPAPSDFQLDIVMRLLSALLKTIQDLLAQLTGSAAGNRGEASAPVSKSSESPAATSRGAGEPPTEGAAETPSTLPSDADGTSDAVKNAAGMPLSVLTDDNGQITVSTEDGYSVVCEGKDQAWRIVGPDGKVTRIWGDPHVWEADGDKWDFSKQSTFRFGNNKVTVQLTPYGNGQYLTSGITIYNGAQRITITGIDANELQLLASSADGKEHDARLNDGDVYTRSATTRGESWKTSVDGKTNTMG